MLPKLVSILRLLKSIQCMHSIKCFHLYIHASILVYLLVFEKKQCPLKLIVWSRHLQATFTKLLLLHHPPFVAFKNSPCGRRSSASAAGVGGAGNKTGNKTQVSVAFFGGSHLKKAKLLVVSAHLKNISQIGSFPQVRVKIQNI